MPDFWTDVLTLPASWYDQVNIPVGIKIKKIDIRLVYIWAHKQIERYIDRQIGILIQVQRHIYIYIYIYIDRQMDRWIDGQMDR